MEKKIIFPPLLWNIQMYIFRTIFPLSSPYSLHEKFTNNLIMHLKPLHLVILLWQNFWGTPRRFLSMRRDRETTLSTVHWALRKGREQGRRAAVHGAPDSGGPSPSRHPCFFTSCTLTAASRLLCRHAAPRTPFLSHVENDPIPRCLKLSHIPRSFHAIPAGKGAPPSSLPGKNPSVLRGTPGMSLWHFLFQVSITFSPCHF